MLSLSGKRISCSAYGRLNQNQCGLRRGSAEINVKLDLGVSGSGLLGGGRVHVE